MGILSNVFALDFLPAPQKVLTKKTRSFMRKLQNHPNQVSNYFKYPKIAYAA